jgi:hypothetical protein
LNSLGYCYYKTGDREEALNVLRASLKLNAAQKNIQELVKRIEDKN